MRGTLALVGGAGLGAGLMYLLDPERGERRRSALSESVACAVNDAADRFPAVASVAADAVAGARQAASRLETPRFVSDLTTRLDAPRRVAGLTEAARRATAMRPQWRNGRVILRRRHPVSFLEDHRWSLLVVAAGTLAAGRRRHRRGCGVHVRARPRAGAARRVGGVQGAPRRGGGRPVNADRIRVAAVGDLHCAKAMTAGALASVFGQVAERAELLALCGDLTDTGTPEEAKFLVRELAVVKVPVVAVLGNHDYESEKAPEVKQILADAGVAVLDGDSVELRGVGFAGVKGFAGGFGERALQAWGEPILKRFVREAVEEALKLEGALARLRTPHRIALMHYSPVRATVTEEPSEIAAFLGSSRLEDPINRYPVTAAFHGHAHRGSPEGRTSSGVPVYNVALPLLRRRFPNDPPFRVIEVQVERTNGGPPSAPPPVHAGAGIGATIP